MKTTNHAAYVAEQANRAMNLEPDPKKRAEMQQVIRQTLDELESRRLRVHWEEGA